jgi:hypothetical protein
MVLCWERMIPAPKASPNQRPTILLLKNFQRYVLNIAWPFAADFVTDLTKLIGLFVWVTFPKMAKGLRQR